MKGTILWPSRPQYDSKFLNAAIHNRPRRRTKAERDLIQGGFTPKPPVRETTSLKVGSLPASCRPENSRQKSPVRPDGYLTYRDARFVHLHPQVGHQESGHEPKLSLDDAEVYEEVGLISYQLDILARGLDVIFCGLNPASSAAIAGHNFSNGTN